MHAFIFKTYRRAYNYNQNYLDSLLVYTNAFAYEMCNKYCVFREVDEKTAGSIERLLTVWNERGIYDTAFIDDLKRTLSKHVVARTLLLLYSARVY